MTATGGVRVIEVSGTHRERGIAHGRQARDLIEQGCDAWLRSLRDDLGTDPEPYLARFLRSTSLVAAMDEHTPWLVEEMKGIADGAGLPYETILAYNLPDEEWWYRQSTTAQPMGCSAIGLRSLPNGRPVIAQNVDVPDYYGGKQIILLSHGDNGLDTFLFGYAGGTGLCGANSSGVAILCNALLTLRHSEHGLPVNCVLRAALAQTSLAGAMHFLGSIEHASGQSYLLGGSGQIAGVECSAAGATEFGRGSERLWHTNHPYVSDDVSSEIDAFPILADSDTLGRGDYIVEKLPEVNDIDGIQAVLSDRSVPICRVPRWENDVITLGSVVIEITSPPRVLLAPGPPDRTPYETVGFDAVPAF